MAAADASKWSDTAMLVIDMQVKVKRGLFLVISLAFRLLVPAFQIWMKALWLQWLQKEFVDPAMSSLALLAGKAILPAVTEAVELARERGIFVVWVGLSPFRLHFCPFLVKFTGPKTGRHTDFLKRYFLQQQMRHQSFCYFIGTKGGTHFLKRTGIFQA